MLTVRDTLRALQTLPRDTELLAFEAGLAPPERAGHGSPQASARRKRLTAKNQTTDRTCRCRKPYPQTLTCGFASVAEVRDDRQP
jgi:hypothetical protein